MVCMRVALQHIALMVRVRVRVRAVVKVYVLQ